MPALRILPARSDTSCADHGKSCELAVGNPNVALSYVKVEVVNEFGRRHKRTDFTMDFDQNFLNVLIEKPLRYHFVGLLPKNPAMLIGDIRPLMRSRIEFGELGSHQLVDSSGIHCFGLDVILMSAVGDMAGRPAVAAFCLRLGGRTFALGLLVIPGAPAVQTPVYRQLSSKPNAASEEYCGGE
jgi:hypothetical protein